MNSSQLYKEASQFIQLCYQELGKSTQEIQERLQEIKQEIDGQGTYRHTLEELEHGAKIAWRNSNRCIGRLFWNTLQVFDQRKARTEEDVRDALFHHINYATNNGKIRPTITIFKPVTENQQQVRIWNHQLIRYAGYETDQGIIGDPHSLDFTKICQQLGWEGKQGTFDILPLVIQIDNQPPKWYVIPQEMILEVPIRHPENPAFTDLHIKWYAVPIIADMLLEIGGIHYTAAPFNGWYMETEIGARNLADESRYNLLSKVAACLDLDANQPLIFWKDRALIELNLAVFHSFQESGVRIVDHHMAAQQFKYFEQQEEHCRRPLTGDWTWLIPPVSPATTHIFHQDYDNTCKTPNFFYQPKPASI